ncbi:MAG: FHA domain-containing protein [Myxococcales bacterium]|nr:FHA domain-containing protein [Myxococcales bacterium]
MPVTLVVRAEGVSLPAVTFDGPRVVLGRSASCDLRLPDASVSARHASIRAQNAVWVLVDEGSTNGTFLNGERLAVQSARKIETGDRVVLGRMQLEVKLGAARASTAEETREIALAMVARAVDGDAATIRVEEGPDRGASLALGAEPKTIGRDPRCALRLSDRAVSPMALEVSAEQGRVRVRACDDRTIAKLGVRYLGPTPLPWADGAALVVGETRLVLSDPIARALDASAELPDEKVAPAPIEETPPPPIAEAAPVVEPSAIPEESPALPRPTHDRRRSYRGASRALEVLALIVGLLVLGGSVMGLLWLLKK